MRGLFSARFEFRWRWCFEAVSFTWQPMANCYFSIGCNLSVGICSLPRIDLMAAESWDVLCLWLCKFWFGFALKDASQGLHGWVHAFDRGNCLGAAAFQKEVLLGQFALNSQTSEALKIAFSPVWDQKTYFYSTHYFKRPSWTTKDLYFHDIHNTHPAALAPNLQTAHI